jgi:hypothetical protein
MGHGIMWMGSRCFEGAEIVGWLGQQGDTRGREGKKLESRRYPGLKRRGLEGMDHTSIFAIVLYSSVLVYI